MVVRSKTLVRGAILAAAAALPSLAVAQPLGIVVNALALPGQIISAPFSAFEAPAANVYNPAPAEAAAVSYTDDMLAVIPAPVLKATGPHYDNPAGADYRRPYVIRRGAIVPGFVNTAMLENVSLAGLAPGGHYDFFVSPEQRTVILDSTSRRVVRILR